MSITATELKQNLGKYLLLSSQEDIYITNIIKCHPPGNRDPKEAEKKACFPYLKYETFLLKPKIIVCLGRIAAQRIISPDFKITRQHGTWTCRKNYVLTATYHPSAVLRDPLKYELVKELISPHLNGMFVTPKDEDELVKQISYTISEALNKLFTNKEEG